MDTAIWDAANYMEPKIIKEIELVRNIVRIYRLEGGREWAEMVAFDAEGNEYTTTYQVYINGTHYDVEHSITQESNHNG